jgi:hypothetical protein
MRYRIASPVVGVIAGVGLSVVDSEGTTVEDVVGAAGFTKAAYADTNARACRGDTASMLISCGVDAGRLIEAAALGLETKPPGNKGATGTLEATAVPLTMPRVLALLELDMLLLLGRAKEAADEAKACENGSDLSE